MLLSGTETIGALFNSSTSSTISVGTYTATQLNTFFGVSAFSGGSLQVTSAFLSLRHGNGNRIRPRCHRLSPPGVPSQRVTSSIYLFTFKAYFPGQCPRQPQILHETSSLPNLPGSPDSISSSPHHWPFSFDRSRSSSFAAALTWDAMESLRAPRMGVVMSFTPDMWDGATERRMDLH